MIKVKVELRSRKVIKVLIKGQTEAEMAVMIV